MQISFILFDVHFDLAPGQNIFGCACSDPSLRAIHILSQIILFCSESWSLFETKKNAILNLSRIVQLYYLIINQTELRSAVNIMWIKVVLLLFTAHSGVVAHLVIHT